MAQEILKAFILIFIAEMGDKTQILAMAFATMYPIRKVLIGIGIGSFLNHGLAVLLGSYLSTLIPISTIQMFAGFAFVGFAIWTLKIDEEEDNEEPKIRFGPIATVALAFFLGELGDKTQLTAITLSADAVYPAMILVGTVAGMVVTGSLGIVIGKKMGDKVPEFAIKLTAASIFMFFGLIKLSQTVPERYMVSRIVLPFIVIVVLIVSYMVTKLLIQRKKGIQSNYVRQSRLLHEYNEHIVNDLEKICMGLECCGECQGTDCLVGYSKEVISKGEIYKEYTYPDYATDDGKRFSIEQAMDSLIDSISLIEGIQEEEKLKVAQAIRKQMELILFKKSIDDYQCIEQYIEEVEHLNEKLARQIKYQYNMRKPIEDRVINLGNKVSNIYLIMIPEGYLLIDTGYREHYNRFLKELDRCKIGLQEIKYIFITHAHDNHVGFLNQILNDSEAKVILKDESVKRLKVGQNSFEGGFTSMLAWGVCQVTKILGKGKHIFEPVHQEDRYLVINEKNKGELESILTGKIVELPGHTMDSIGLLIDSKILFCGDATMNGIPSRNNITLWIESVIHYKNSWQRMIDLEFSTIYPSHGKPFSKANLFKNSRKLNKIKLH